MFTVSAVVLGFTYMTYIFIRYANEAPELRDPVFSSPRLESAFVKFAQNRNCELKNWTFVDDQFDLFYALGGITDSMLTRVSELDRTNTCRFDHLQKTLSPKNCAGVLENVLLTVLKELNVNETLSFTINGLDEPRIIMPAEEYVSIEPSFWNSLMRNKVHSPESLLSHCQNVPIVKDNAKLHGLFLSPASLDLVFNTPLPIFSSASVKSCTADIVIPSSYAMYEYLPSDEPPVEFRNKTDWDAKIPKLYWRGSSTGAQYASGRYDLINGAQRSRLVGMYGRTPTVNNKVSDEIRKIQILNQTRRQNVYDIGFTSFGQCDEPMCSEMESAFTALPRDPATRAMDYKYLIDVDGNSFSRRMVYLLRWSSGLVFKSTLFMDWVGAFMEPWKHYVPVSVELSDLDELVSWAENNDKEAKEIVKRGREQADKRLRYEDMECYWARVMMHYDHLVNEGKR